MEKDDVEAINYNGKKWINEKHLETALGYNNLVSKTQYHSDKFKKRRCEIKIAKIFHPVENLLQKN